MEERLEEVAVAWLERGLDADERDVGVLRPLDHRAGRELGDVQAPDVDAGRAAEREKPAGVPEQHDRARLRRVAALDVRPTRRRPRAAPVRVDVRVVEQPEPELVAEQPPHRRVDARLVDPARAHELDDDLGAGLAAELVDAGVEAFSARSSRAQVLDAPGAGGPDRAGEQRVVEQPPVGADDAVEAVALAEQPGDHAVG